MVFSEQGKKEIPEYIKKTFFPQPFGIHTSIPYDELKVIDDKIIINPAVLWAGGWVLLDKTYLIYLSDIPLLVVGAVLHISIASIYVSVISDGNIFHGALEDISHHKIRLSSLYKFSFIQLKFSTNELSNVGHVVAPRL